MQPLTVYGYTVHLEINGTVCHVENYLKYMLAKNAKDNYYNYFLWINIIILMMITINWVVNIVEQQKDIGLPYNNISKLTNLSTVALPISSLCPIKQIGKTLCKMVYFCFITPMTCLTWIQTIDSSWLQLTWNCSNFFYPLWIFTSAYAIRA